MIQSIMEAVAQEDRWRRSRDSLRLVDPSAANFATSGLGGYVDDLRMRLVVQPNVPGCQVIEFDDEFWTWFSEPRRLPFAERSYRWGQPQPAPHGAALADGDKRGEWSWDQYLAVHRDGGVECGLGQYAAHGANGTEYIRLVNILGRVWATLSFTREVRDRYGLEGELEVTLALCNVGDARLGDLAADWTGMHWEPGRYEPRTCADNNVLRVERTEALTCEEDVRDLTYRLGAWIENCWGSTQRRYLTKGGAPTFDGANFR